MATSPQSPPRRPRLSLQIKALANGPSGRTSRCLAAAVDVTSPTSFNTLSNVYATAVDRSTPVQENPPTAFLGRRPVLRLQTQNAVAKNASTNTPYLGPYLDTPVTAQPASPAVANPVCFPSAMTATPPLSAQPPEQNGAQVFTFDGAETAPAAAAQPGTRGPSQAAQQNPKRRTATHAAGAKLPYTHPRSLRSILRNSPLPPLSTRSPESPRRQSLRLQEKAARRVAYNSPLTQEITTSKYVKSHIDLLVEDTTPISPSASSSDDCDSLLDQAMADADSTRDGGQTPGPFEDMRRRMANMHASTPTALSPTGGGIRKRGGKRREKKRRWVWTIGQDDESEPTTATTEPAPATPSVPVLAVPSPRPRTRNQQAQAQMARAVADATQNRTQAQQQVPLLAVPVPPARTPPQSNRDTAATTTTGAPQHSPHACAHVQQQQQQQTRGATASLSPARASTPDSSASDTRHATPEPAATHPLLAPGGTDDRDGSASMVIEPPTPSMESTTSTASSVHSVVFEGRGADDGIDGDGYDEDVEMSDAGSFTSVEDAAEGTGDDGVKGFGGGGGVIGLGLGVGDGGEYTTYGGYHDRYRHPRQGCQDGGEREGDADMDEGTPTMTARPVGVGGVLGRPWAPWREEGVGS